MRNLSRISTYLSSLFLVGLFGIATPTPASALDFGWGAKVTGSGTVKSETRAVSGYTGIALSVPAVADIVQGSSEGIVIETDDNILPLIETVIEDSKLKIRFKDRNMSVSTKTLKMTINVKTIDSLAVAGAGNLRASKLQAGKLKTSIAGSGDVRITALDVDTLAVSIAGSGDFAAGGKANSVEAKIAGSGNLKIGTLASGSVKISIAGSGDATVWAKESLTISVAGSGDISYYGDPKVKQSVAGSGSVKRLGAAPSGV